MVEAPLVILASFVLCPSDCKDPAVQAQVFGITSDAVHGTEQKASQQTEHHVTFSKSWPYSKNMSSIASDFLANWRQDCSPSSNTSIILSHIRVNYFLLRFRV